jgi:hypothetical protein
MPEAACSKTRVLGNPQGHRCEEGYRQDQIESARLASLVLDGMQNWHIEAIKKPPVLASFSDEATHFAFQVN